MGGKVAPLESLEKAGGASPPEGCGIPPNAPLDFLDKDGTGITAAESPLKPTTGEGVPALLKALLEVLAMEGGGIMGMPPPAWKAELEALDM